MRTGAQVGSLIGGTRLCLPLSLLSVLETNEPPLSIPYTFTHSLSLVIPKTPELERQAISRNSNCHIEDDLMVVLEVQSQMGNSSQKRENLAGSKDLTELYRRSRFLRFPVDLGSKNFRQQCWRYLHLVLPVLEMCPCSSLTFLILGIDFFSLLRRPSWD